MRIPAAFLMAVLLSATFIIRDASAGPIQTMAFNFANDGSPAYRIVGGDRPFEATAQLFGNLVLQYDTTSGEAWISTIVGTLHTPVQTIGGSPGGLAWLEGADVEAEVRGLKDGLPGVQTGIMQFTFGPGVTADSHYNYEFVLSAAEGAARLSGRSEFNGGDGATIFLNAPLVYVPEPAGLLGAGIAAIALLTRSPRCRRAPLACRQ